MLEPLAGTLRGRILSIGSPASLAKNHHDMMDWAERYGVRGLWESYTAIAAIQLVTSDPLSALAIASHALEFRTFFAVMIRIPQKELYSPALWRYSMVLLFELRTYVMINRICFEHSSDILKDGRHIDGRELARHFPWVKYFGRDNIPIAFLDEVKSL
jgi:hypothetical protein